MNKGGSAFPCNEVRDANGNGIMEGSSGMSLRDWFAGQALVLFAPQKHNGNYSTHDRKHNIPEDEAGWMARRAYDIAEAMLAEREKYSEKGQASSGA